MDTETPGPASTVFDLLSPAELADRLHVGARTTDPVLRRVALVAQW